MDPPGPHEARVKEGTEARSRVEEFRKRHQTSLVTMLFTDLAGSTRLKQERGDSEAVALLQVHADLTREVLRNFPEGREISTAGDSFFCVFVRPSDAVAFALRLQSRMRRDLHPEGIAMRIGIHLGEVVVEENAVAGKPLDLFGLQVDTAARVMSLAEGGQILCTRAVFDNARQVLKGRDHPGLAELVWLNHGPYELKGVEEPVEVCEVGEQEAGILRAPAASEKAHPAGMASEELGWRPAPDGRIPATEWTLEGKLGEGAFGEVWSASHRHSRERRVFKFCFLRDRSRALRRELTLFRLIRERIGEHPSIVRLHEVFLESPPFYLGMEHVRGRDLRAWLSDGTRLASLPVAAKLEIAAQIADALDAAHRAGVIHQDLKPQNVLVDEAAEPLPSGAPRVKLADFGVGRVTNQEALARISLSGSIESLLKTAGAGSDSGTFLYMAPERVEGHGATPQSDLYSLGVMLFQMMAGDLDRSVTQDWKGEVADAIVREDLQRLLAGRPEGRFASAKDLAASLRSWRARRVRRRAARAAGAFLAAGALALAGYAARAQYLRAGRAELPKEAGEALQRGREALARKDWPAAASEMEAAYAAAPQEPDVLRGLGEAYAGSGRGLPAAACWMALREALRDGPEADALLARLREAVDGERSRKGADPEVQAADASRAIRIFGSFPEAFDLRACARAGSGELDLAVADAARAAELDPVEPRYRATRAAVLTLRALAKAGLGDPEGAQADAGLAMELGLVGERSLAALDAISGAYLRRAEEKQAQGDLDGALADATRAVEARPKDATPLVARARIRLARIDLLGCAEDCERAIALDAADAAAYDIRGKVRKHQGDYEGSVADYTEAIRRSAGSDLQVGLYHARRAWAHWEFGEMERAEIDYAEADRIYPNLFEVFDGRGWMRIRQRRYDQAIDLMDSLLETNQSHSNGYNVRGYAKLLAGDLPGALADYDEMAKVGPDEAVVYATRGYVKARLGRFREAEQDLARAREAATSMSEKFWTAYWTAAAKALEAETLKESAREEGRARALDAIVEAMKIPHLPGDCMCHHLQKDHLREDGDFAALRDSPRFKRLVDER